MYNNPLPSHYSFTGRHSTGHMNIHDQEGIFYCDNLQKFYLLLRNVKVTAAQQQPYTCATVTLTLRSSKILQKIWLQFCSKNPFADDKWALFLTARILQCRHFSNYTREKLLPQGTILLRDFSSCIYWNESQMMADTEETVQYPPQTHGYSANYPSLTDDGRHKTSRLIIHSSDTYITQ